MLIGVFLLLAFATVPLRGGRIMALADMRFRAPWLVFIAIALQIGIINVFPDGSASLLRIVHLSSYAFLGAFVMANGDLPYMWMITVGGLCNLLAIMANDGVMPASESALRVAGRTPPGGDFINSAPVPDAHLAFLGDVLAIPSWSPVANVFSIGDVLLVVGALLALHAICGSRPWALRGAARAQQPAA